MRIEGAIATMGMVAQQETPTQPPAQGSAANNVIQAAAQAQQTTQQGDGAKPVGSQFLNKAVQQVGHILTQFDEGIEFKIHKDATNTSTIIVAVVDRSTGKVIREIPSEKFIDMIAQFQKQLSGLMVDENR